MIEVCASAQHFVLSSLAREDLVSATPVRRPLPFLCHLLLCATVLAATSPSSSVADPAKESGPVQVLVKTRVPLTDGVVSTLSAKASRVSFVWPEIRAMAVTMSASRIADLEADPLVELVEPDVLGDLPNEQLDALKQAQALITGPLPPVVEGTAGRTWNQDMADTEGSAYTGAGVTVAVVDAGLPQNWREFLPEDRVDLEHAAGVGAEGWGDFHNPVKLIPSAGGWMGLHPHGVAVSSVIVGFPSDAGFVGGSAPGATILPIRVLGQFNTAWGSWNVAAFLYLARLKESGAIPGPLVVNFSLQYQGYSQVFADAIDYMISKGVLFVTIAGNFHPTDNVSFPGLLPQSITAAAAGWRREGLDPQPWFFGDVPENDASQVYVASFSGREGPFVTPASQIDVLAPGSFVFGEWLLRPGYSEGRQSKYTDVANFIFGTSFAAPHVAGIVAQMLEKNPALTQAQAEATLRGTALAIPPQLGGVNTPFQSVLPWDARATGVGLARGTAAVAATSPALWPLRRRSPGIEPSTRASRPEAAARPLGVNVTSPPGTLPVEFVVHGLAGNGATLSVFDPMGRLVRRWDAPALTGGRGTWDGSGVGGERAGRGVFFLVVDSAHGRTSTKVVVVR
jgi:subtilisin family serine protease